MNKIGIIGAMELEVETLKASMDITNILTRAGMTFYEGTLHTAPVVIVRSGVGKVNAAICVQILADIFQVTHIINTGVAGSLNAALNIGDIVLSRDVIHHDVDATIFGYAPGEIPQLGIREFPGDEKMLQLAESSCREMNPELQVMSGRIVSGDQFVSDKTAKQKLIDTFQGDCTEMEGAAIAHAAYLNKIPFIIIRAISDKADDSAEMDYPTFERQAAHHCARLTGNFVQNLC